MSQTCGDQPLELLLRYRNRLTGKWINGALYVAKHSGRNRVSLAEPDEPKTPAAGGG